MSFPSNVTHGSPLRTEPVPKSERPESDARDRVEQLIENRKVFKAPFDTAHEPCAEGKIAYPDGTIYTGQLKNYRRHGYGKTVYANGRIHEGHYFEDERSGPGKLAFANGPVIEKHFSDGAPIDFDQINFTL